jgi:glyoxylase-like metal-dependent hydrolase (beta-lactamase superfamily II)
MGAGHFRFTVGSFDCLAVSDGALVGGPEEEAPAPVLFANAPSAELDAALRESGIATPWTQWTEEITCLLVDTGARRILVDAGAGALDPQTGRLIENLADAGIAPSDIDTVILSHGHPDHIGGLVDGDGSLIFPTAPVLLSKKEWRFWMEGEAERVLPAETGAFLLEFAVETLPIVQQCLELVDDEGEPFGGVHYLPAPGHTPGHLAVELLSRGERLLFIADLVLHPLHVAHPDWYSVVDADPVLVAQTRRALFAKAADEDCLVHAFHFPFPGLGRLHATSSGYSWAGVS